METQDYKNHVLIDTNFILTSIKNKIDFIGDLEGDNLTPIIPEEVLKELERLKVSTKANERQQATVALGILKKRIFKKIKLNTRNVDAGIVIMARKFPELIVATLDRGIRNKIRNKKLTIKSAYRKISE